MHFIHTTSNENIGTTRVMMIKSTMLLMKSWSSISSGVVVVVAFSREKKEGRFPLDWVGSYVLRSWTNPTVASGGCCSLLFQSVSGIPWENTRILSSPPQGKWSLGIVLTNPLFGDVARNERFFTLVVLSNKLENRFESRKEYGPCNSRESFIYNGWIID